MRADWDRRAVECYRSLQCSLCPRWQQTQACTDNAPASSEKSVSNCLWCWPTQAQWQWGMKTRWSHIWIECNRENVRWSVWTRRWKSTRGSQWHTLKHQPVWTHGGRRADLLHVFLGPDVRRVHQRAHDLQVAVDDQGLVRPIGVDADPAVVVDRIRQLASLPQHLVIAFKLARVGSLEQTHKHTPPHVLLNPHPQGFRDLIVFNSCQS